MLEMRRTITKAEVQRDPYAVWNAFVGLLALSSYQELDDVQGPAHLAFWYESEVQNGGHLQSFENRPSELTEPTLAALRILQADRYVPILSEAIRRWRSRPREKFETAEAFVSAGIDGEFDDLDKAYYSSEATMIKLLENYLYARQNAFLIIES
jgi:hypothetical protein